MTDVIGTIVITVRENDFDVKTDGFINLDELYLVAVSLAQQLEAEAASYLDSPGSSMVH